MKILWLASAFSLLAVACGARSGGNDRAITEVPHGPADREMTPPPGTFTSCPANFKEAQGGRCAFGRIDRCTYSEGTCDCPEPPQCGGVQHPPPFTGAPLAFECTPRDPKATKADGCPYLEPPANDFCTSVGLRCSYGECSWSTDVATCTAGAWQIEHHLSEPPP